MYIQEAHRLWNFVIFFGVKNSSEISKGVAIKTTILNLYLSPDQGSWLETKSKILGNWSWVLLGPEILGERWRGMYDGIWDTKPTISLKRSNL